MNVKEFDKLAKRDFENGAILDEIRIAIKNNERGQELIKALFNALDDSARYIYSQSKLGGDPPSELTINTLIEIEHCGLGLRSKALERMNKEAAFYTVNKGL